MRIQRRNIDDEVSLREPSPQIGTKCREVLVRSGDDSNVEFSRGRRSKRPNLSVLKEPQNSRLQFRTDFRDLVEENSSSVCCLQ